MLCASGVMAADPTITITVSKWATVPDPPTGFTITQISLTSINITWTKGTAANMTIVRGSTTGYPFTILDGSGVYSGNGTSVVVEDLDLDTNTYYYRAWSQNEYGTSSGYAQASIGAEADDSIAISLVQLVTGDWGIFQMAFIIALVGFSFWKRGWIRVLLSICITIWGAFAMSYDIKIAAPLLAIGTVLFIMGILRLIRNYRSQEAI